MATIDTNNIKIRPFIQQDVKALWQLMYELAVFENYDEQFKITEESLVKYGLNESPRFHCYVAHKANSHDLLGMAVLYHINWTFDLKPTVVLKELYVKASARGQNVGQLLMQAVARHAKHIGAPRVKWLVLSNNPKAKSFYQKIGADHDQVWENWQLNETAINDLTD